MLNSISESIISGTPVVPTFESNKSPFCGWHLCDRIECSSGEMYFVLEKDNTPELISFTDKKGMPLVVYLGVECVPSVNCQYI